MRIYGQKMQTDKPAAAYQWVLPKEIEQRLEERERKEAAEAAARSALLARDSSNMESSTISVPGQIRLRREPSSTSPAHRATTQSSASSSGVVNLADDVGSAKATGTASASTAPIGSSASVPVRLTKRPREPEASTTVTKKAPPATGHPPKGPPAGVALPKGPPQGLEVPVRPPLQAPTVPEGAARAVLAKPVELPKPPAVPERAPAYYNVPSLNTQIIALPFCDDSQYAKFSRTASAILRHTSALDYAPDGMVNRVKFVELMNDRLRTDYGYAAIMARIIMGSNKERFHVRSVAGFPVFKPDDDAYYDIKEWEEAIGRRPTMIHEIGAIHGHSVTLDPERLGYTR